ncbi:MAG: hypothetical protein IKC79_01955, partial [Clostridia bacterium]|nr:hypothetical protein [Clostridia bacterium]
YLDAGWDFDNVWTISRSRNDQFPVLRVFMHGGKVSIITDIQEAGTYSLTYNGIECTDMQELSDGLDLEIGTEVILSADANEGYRFAGWYYYVLDYQGNIVYTQELLSNLLEYNLGQIMDDYLIEARFVKTFEVIVEDLFTGFEEYTDTIYIVEQQSNMSTQNGVYDNGTILTITIDKTKVGVEFDGIKYKMSQDTNYSADNINDVWLPCVETERTLVYTLNVVEGVGAFAYSDTLYLQLQFMRVFRLNMGLELSEPVDQHVPVAVAEWRKGEQTITIQATKNGVYGNESAEIRYDTTFTINQIAYGGARTFDGWVVGLGGNFYEFDTVSSRMVIQFDNPQYQDVFGFSNVDYDIILTARYSMQKYSVTVNNIFGGTKDIQDENLNYALGSMSIVQSGYAIEMSQLPTDGIVIEQIEYGKRVRVAFVPAINHGYKLTNVYLGDIDSVTTYEYVSPNAQLDYYYFEIAKLEQDIEFTIKYEYVPITINVVAVHTDGTAFLDNQYTVSGATGTKNYYSQISTTNGEGGIKVTLNNDLKKHYGYSGLLATIGGDDYSIECNLTNADYNLDTYVLFTNLNKVLDIYGKADVVLTENNNSFTLKLVLQTMSRTLNVVRYYEGTTTPVLDADSEIIVSADDSVTIVHGSQYVEDATITIVASATNIGHKFKGFKTAVTDTSYVGTLGADTYGNSGEYSIVIAQNLTVYAYYEKRTYDVEINSNIPDLDASLSTFVMQQQGIYVKIAGVDKTMDGIDTKMLIGKYADSVELNFDINKRFDVNGGILVRLHKIEIVVNGNTVEYNQEYNTYAFMLLFDADKVQINFVYRLIQQINIVLDSTKESTSMANGTLLKLMNTNTKEVVYVVLTKAMNGVTVDLPAGEYELEFYLPIFCQAIVDINNSGSLSELDTKFMIEVTDTSTDISIEDVQKSLSEAVTYSFIVI